MATNTTEVVDLEHKQDTRGRRLAGVTRRTEVLAGYAGCGLTQKAYARREGVNYHTLVAWLGQSRREGGASAGRSAPAASAPPVRLRFAEVRVSGANQSPPLEVVLPDGMIVRGIDPTTLLTLIRGLRS